MRAIYNSILEQLQSFAQGAGFSDCVIGLSGGLDSTVVAVVCAQAFGPKRVHGILLPGPYSSDHSVEDALELAANLEMPTETISITQPYQAFASALTPHFEMQGSSFVGIASENTQARCRMVVLMALSNAHGWMLVNTGNKSEAYMGYSTLYGDTAGAFAPIGNLYKTQVYELANYINDQARAEGRRCPIPQRVIDKPPSAELAADQTDEKGLGILYPELDRILMGHYEQGMSAAQLANEKTNESDVQTILNRAERYAYKRMQLPSAAVLP